MRVLVTGAGGFVGNHLLRELTGRGHEVFAATHCCSGITAGDFVRWEFDILDLHQVEDMLGEIKPAGIIHLAAQSMVKVAWEHPAHTMHVNAVGTINLIETVKKVVPKARIINVGSGEEYGLSGKLGEPLSEQHACLPQNPYASSKLAAGQIALQLAKKDNLKVIHTRAFNHFGPGQPQGFVVSDFAAQIAHIEHGLAENVVRVGDLSAQRDFTDVRDVVRAYALLLESNAENGIFNICSGFPRAAKEILDLLISKAKVPIRIQVDKDRFRPAEVPLFIGSAVKIETAVGWRTERNFSDSLAETLAWWRNEI